MKVKAFFFSGVYGYKYFSCTYWTLETYVTDNNRAFAFYQSFVPNGGTTLLVRKRSYVPSYAVLSQVYESTSLRKQDSSLYLIYQDAASLSLL